MMGGLVEVVLGGWKDACTSTWLGFRRLPQDKRGFCCMT